MLCMTLLKFQHDRVTQKKSCSKSKQLQELKEKVLKIWLTSNKNYQR